MRQHAILSVLIVFATLSFVNCGDDSSTPSGPDEKLTATITSPESGELFSDDEIITFTGTGTDPEDGDLTGTSLTWTSDKDDTLGTGTSVARDDLSVNTHVITLTAKDSDDNTATDIITIYVESGPGPAPFGMIAIPATAGFDMGYTGMATPIHSVSLDAFQIGGYEVTYSLWTTVRDWAVAYGGYSIRPGQSGTQSVLIDDSHPVTYVPWHDCIAWCNAYSEMNGLTPVYYNSGETHTGVNVYRNSYTGGDITNADVDWEADGFRLPTEAEWEYAARYMTGGITAGNQHSGYNIDSNPDNCAWYGSNSGNTTHPVGEKTQNSLGAYDMSGSVREWCWDLKGSYPDEAIDNPTGPDNSSTGYRVLRGGYWHGYLVECYTSYRFGQYPTLGNTYCGFRVARGVSGN